MVKPLRPFDLRRGKIGLGAWEVGGRYNWLGLGDEVFTRGLADPDLWTNRVATFDVGLNWYLTQYLKVAILLGARRVRQSGPLPPGSPAADERPLPGTIPGPILGET